MSIFIIGEIGINHNGNMEIAKNLIDVAVESGADAVKFQKRTIEKVYTESFLSSYRESPWGTTQRDQKEGLEFNEKEYKEIDIIDIFCGTGSLGIEAISRGSKNIFFIDNSKKAINLTKMNCEKLKIKNVNLLNYNFFDINLSFIKQADVIFLDPPYKIYDPSEILRILLSKNLLKVDGILIFETSTKNKVQDFKELRLLKKKNVSKSSYYFFIKI